MKTQPNEPLERQLISIMGEHREDSYATQRKRFYELRAAAREIKDRFGLQKWDNLGRKHVEFLVGRWKDSALEPRTVTSLGIVSHLESGKLSQVESGHMEPPGVGSC